VDLFTAVDLHYGLAVMDAAAEITVSAMNATDEDPPLAPNEFGYDSYTHNPQGHIYKVGLN